MPDHIITYYSGVNGRYKGPFMNMNLLSRDLRCNEDEWQKVDILFSKWNEAKDLIIQFLPILKRTVWFP